MFEFGINVSSHYLVSSAKNRFALPHELSQISRTAVGLRLGESKLTMQCLANNMSISTKGFYKMLSTP